MILSRQMRKQVTRTFVGETESEELFRERYGTLDERRQYIHQSKGRDLFEVAMGSHLPAGILWDRSLTLARSLGLVYCVITNVVIPPFSLQAKAITPNCYYINTAQCDKKRINKGPLILNI